VAHLFVVAPSGRSKCRGCGGPIARGELRFGECLPNLFGEGEMTLWFHPLCAAYKRPHAILEALAIPDRMITDREILEQAARCSAAARKRPRIDGAELSPSGQARCRHCREPIARGSWRIRLVFYEEGRFSPGGYIHLGCRGSYFEVDDVLQQVLHFSSALGDNERASLMSAALKPTPADAPRRSD